MKKLDITTKCYITAIRNSDIDPALENHGFCHGIIIFAIPEFGILFRCRADGELVDMEFGALFALLKFIQTKLSKERVKTLQVMSSNPEFVFSFTGNSRHLKADSSRMRMIIEYQREFRIAIGYIDPIKNKALISSADYPSIPASRSVSLMFDDKESNKPRFKPFQTGIKL